MKDQYFLDMYAAEPDPWGFTSRWYEQRKYQITMAALPRARYRRAFEPGCSVGVLTALLAGRVDHLDARDLVPAAVEQTTARVAALATKSVVDVGRWDMRDPWPEASFDLIVLSEVLYYLEADEAARFMAQTVEHLDVDGHVVVAHWQTRVPEYPLSGGAAQQIARETRGLQVLATYRDEDFVLDVLGRTGAASVATTTGLR